jgi:dipeptide/tripeptide permease
MRIDTQQLTLDEIRDFKGKYPKQLWYLFLIEMWERFCFYGMRGVFTIVKYKFSQKNQKRDHGIPWFNNQHPVYLHNDQKYSLH